MSVPIADVHGHRNVRDAPAAQSRLRRRSAGWRVERYAVTACPRPRPRSAPDAMLSFRWRPVSSAMPNCPGPSTASTSSDVAPPSGDLEVVNEPGAVHRDRGHETALHQIDEDRREAGLDDMRAEAPDDAATRSRRARGWPRRRRENRRPRADSAATRASPANAASPDPTRARSRRRGLCSAGSRADRSARRRDRIPRSRISWGHPNKGTKAEGARHEAGTDCGVPSCFCLAALRSNGQRSRLLTSPSHFVPSALKKLFTESTSHRRSCRSGTLGDGVAIRGEREVTAGKSRHEHQERRPRQVEVRQQRVDDREAVPGVDEQLGLRRCRPATPSCSVRRRLQRAWWSSCRRRRRGGRRACAAAIACGRRLEDRETLGVDVVVLDAIDADRFERAVADVQRDRRPADAGRRGAADEQCDRSAGRPSAPRPSRGAVAKTVW